MELNPPVYSDFMGGTTDDSIFMKSTIQYLNEVMMESFIRCYVPR